MKEKKVNRVLLYLLGFLCGHSAVVGMHPFMVPMLAAVYSIRQSTFGLFAAMLFGGAVMYGIGGWNAGNVFQMGPYVMGEQQLPVTYFLLKYSLILIGVLVGLNLTEGVRRNLSEHTDRSGKKTKRKGVKQSYGTNIRWILAGICAILVFGISTVCGLMVEPVQNALPAAGCEAVISTGLIPAFRKGLEVILLHKRERDHYNEELLGILIVVTVCIWGMPYKIGGVVTWLLMTGLYLSWYTLHRFGAGYGMAVTGVCGLITAIKSGQAEFVGSFFICAILVLAGRALSDKKKTGTIVSVLLACILIGLTYDPYFLTPEGIKSAGSAVLLFAATPKWMLTVRDGWIQSQYNFQTATEINRITAEKIRELSGAFKRIEYTLAGCGPAAAKVDLGEIGDMIGRFSDNLETAEPVPFNREEQLRMRFLEQGVIMTHLSSMKNEMDHVQYYITARTKNQKIMLSKDAADILSEVFDKPIRASEDTSAIISENDRVITFEECARYRCSYFVRRIKKYGSNVSGDNFSVKEHEDGRLVMMISDGMGSGSLASCESTLMIDTMEELLDAGFDPSYGIAFSNNCISEKNSGRCFTTFDMGIVDLYNGELTQYKQGAAPTYIIHSEGIEVLCGASLPIGVLPEAECDVIHQELEPEDRLVMVSDGAFGDEEDMRAILENLDTEDCKETLEYIISQVLLRCEGRLEDDVTVIVAKLEIA